MTKNSLTSKQRLTSSEGRADRARPSAFFICGEGRHAMNLQAYNRLREIVYDQSGIRLGDGKMSMVSARIAKRLRALQIADELAYVEYVEQAMESELVHLLDVISTNVTSFFREAHH